MSAVSVGEDGIVAAKEVADAVAGVMCALNQLESRQYQSAEDASVNEFRTTRQAEGLAKVAGLDADEFKVRPWTRGGQISPRFPTETKYVYLLNAILVYRHGSVECVCHLVIALTGLGDIIL